MSALSWQIPALYKTTSVLCVMRERQENMEVVNLIWKNYHTNCYVLCISTKHVQLQRKYLNHINNGDWIHKCLVDIPDSVCILNLSPV